LRALAKAGLEHIQLSFQDSDAASGDHLSGYADSHVKKLQAAAMIHEAGLALTVNFVVHRQNLQHLDAMLEMAVALGARRVEIANAQYYGWALRNRAALMPSRAQLDAMTDTMAAARERLRGIITIDYVVPDYYARRPKACMGGWGRRFINVTPSGNVLPCHAAETIPDMQFDNLRDKSLREIWHGSDAFTRFRGVDWMPEPCRSCDRREIDWGGCRCQALAITGDAARVDPACELSEDHARLQAIAAHDAESERGPFIYRRFAPRSG
jgi:pyrroloquinoline quinone biosynthesis protein E